jgi:hypothetical protein
MKLFLPFFLISILSFAQSEPEEVFENRIFEAGLSFNMPQGDYLKKIKTDYGPENSIGFSTSYLINPLRKKDELSLVFIGGEFNFESVKQSNFTGFVASDGYFNFKEIFAKYQFCLRSKSVFVKNDGTNKSRSGRKNRVN